MKRMEPVATETCLHCRLPLPSRPLREEVDGVSAGFCCIGCITVFHLVGSGGESGAASWLLAKLGLAAILSGNVMMFQSLLYFGSIQSLGADVLRTASWIMLGLSAAVYLLLGVPMLRLALRAARSGRLVLESLIALGSFGAIVASAVETFRGGTNVYYDSGTMVLVLVVLGQYLEARARQRAADALRSEASRTVRLARVVRDHTAVQVPPSEVHPDEQVEVRAGEEIPVDGRVLEGLSRVHEPALTGESMPRLARPGDWVHAGAIALDGALRVQASGESETLAARIARWSARAIQERAPTELLADRYVARFIPAVVAVAILSFAGLGLAWGRWNEAALAALSVVVVSCPCALGIATPMATTIAIGRAAERGVLFRSGKALESLSRVRAVAFDKTGTLTCGRPAVRGIELREGISFDERRLCSYAASVARLVDHPLTKAIEELAPAGNADSPSASAGRSIAGGGIEARVDGHRVLLGSLALLRAEGVAADTAAEPEDDDASHVHVAIDGRWAATIHLEDALRPEAAEAIAAIRALGLFATALSGDRPQVVRLVTRELGLDAAEGGLRPDEKPREIERLRDQHGPVAMVGDGINDAPALAAADVGIAFGPAADLARNTADVVVVRSDLHEIARGIRLARRTMRIVRQNLAWAFAYNGVAIAMAALGMVRPIVAATAMVASSLFVVGNSSRLARVEPAAGARIRATERAVNAAEA
jgi:heavy metal translocating P-type ATPase